MSIVNYEELKNVSIEEIIKYIKEMLITRICKIFAIDNEIDTIKNKINNVNLELFGEKEFQDTYLKNNGRGKAPGAFYINGKVYLRNYENISTDIHIIVHEILHAISDNGLKHGFLQVNNVEKYYYGYGFNEAITEYLTSLILEESFYGYSQDLNYIIQIFKYVSDLNNNDLLTLYFSENEWLTESLKQKFSNNSNDLSNLIIEYDQRLPQTKKRDFNPNNVIAILFSSIKI